MNAAQRSLRARAAAFAMHAMGGTNTRPAFEARMRKLEDRVDPDRTLTPPERAKRARQLLRADMTALALRSSLARTHGAAANHTPADPPRRAIVSAPDRPRPTVDRETRQRQGGADAG